MTDFFVIYPYLTNELLQEINYFVWLSVQALERMYENKIITISSGFKHWQIADMIGVADTTFCRMLRRELPEDKKQEILTAIQTAKGTV